jgi:hypothetical protein
MDMQDKIYKQNILYYLRKNYLHELIILLHYLLNNKENEYDKLDEYEKAIYDFEEICFLKKEIDLIYERICVLSKDLSNDLDEKENE